MKVKNESEPKGVIEILDDLIAKSYKTISSEPKKLNKVGELLKMIKERRELTPTDVEQKKFWQMINKIRRETLGQPKTKTGKTTKSKKKK